MIPLSLCSGPLRGPASVGEDFEAGPGTSELQEVEGVGDHLAADV